MLLCDLSIGPWNLSTEKPGVEAGAWGLGVNGYQVTEICYNYMYLQASLQEFDVMVEKARDKSTNSTTPSSIAESIRGPL